MTSTAVGESTSSSLDDCFSRPDRQSRAEPHSLVRQDRPVPEVEPSRFHAHGTALNHPTQRGGKDAHQTHHAKS
jgi:hypothetical protein